MLDPARLAAAPILGEGLKQLVDEHEGPADTHITAPTSMRKHTVYEVLAEELHSKLEDPQLGRKKGALLFLEFAEYPLEKAFKMTSFEGSKKPPGDRMDGCTSLEDGTVWICGVPVTGAGRLGLRKQFMIVAVLLFLFIAIATYVDLDDDIQLTQADSRAAFTLRAIEVHARARPRPRPRPRSPRSAAPPAAPSPPPPGSHRPTRVAQMGFLLVFLIFISIFSRRRTTIAAFVIVVSVLIGCHIASQYYIGDRLTQLVALLLIAMYTICMPPGCRGRWRRSPGCCS